MSLDEALKVVKKDDDAPNSDAPPPDAPTDDVTEKGAINLAEWQGVRITNHVPGAFKFRFEGKIVEDPPNRKISFINELSTRRGLYPNWRVYTLDDYLHDQKLYPGFQFVVPPTIDGNRLMIKGHWAVWIPRQLYDEQRRQEQLRTGILLGREDLPESTNTMDVWGFAATGKPGDKANVEKLGEIR